MGTALLTEFNRYFGGIFYIFSPPKNGMKRALCEHNMYFGGILTPVASTETLPEIKSNYMNEKQIIF